MTTTAFIGPDRASSPVPDTARTEIAHALRLLRLVITAVDHAESGTLVLTADSALVGLCRRLLKAGDGDLHATRTAVMALRDLVWRVDTARAFLERGDPAADLSVLAAMLDTHDIHAFLRQEP